MLSRPDLKVILMSATLNAELFSQYFGESDTHNNTQSVYCLGVCPGLRWSAHVQHTQRRVPSRPVLLGGCAANYQVGQCLLSYYHMQLWRILKAADQWTCVCFFSSV